MTRILTVPGWEGSGPQHWQSQWERLDAAVTRVEQDDWNRPTLDAWRARLVDAARGAPTVLAAHSLGSVLVAHAAPSLPDVVGALLVAPPQLSPAPPELATFVPTPRARLPFPAMVVASRDDPWSPFERSAELAAAWGAELVDAGKAGHLNGESALGTWAFGRALLQRLVARAPFALDARLARDAHVIGQSTLSTLLLMDDARYPWLVLVPRRSGAVELSDLTADDRRALAEESEVVAAALTACCAPDKLNIATLGNVVRQLHVHHVARRLGDPAWPGPVWGHSPRVPRTEPARRELVVALAKHEALAARFALEA
jgi:hypothetical protein